MTELLLVLNWGYPFSVSISASAISSVDLFLYVGARFACTSRQTREAIYCQMVGSVRSSYGLRKILPEIFWKYFLVL